MLRFHQLHGVFQKARTQIFCVFGKQLCYILPGISFFFFFCRGWGFGILDLDSSLILLTHKNYGQERNGRGSGDGSFRLVMEHPYLWLNPQPQDKHSCRLQMVWRLFLYGFPIAWTVPGEVLLPWSFSLATP